MSFRAVYCHSELVSESPFMQEIARSSRAMTKGRVRQAPCPTELAIFFVKLSGDKDLLSLEKSVEEDDDF